MAKRRSTFPLFVLAVFALAAWMYFSPYLALRKLQRAAEAGDTRAMNELVDFPALRESVKQEVRSAVAGGISSEGERNPAAALAGVFAGMLAAPMVDAFVTPTGIAALTRGERPDQARERDGEGEGEGPDRPRALEEVDIHRGYEGWNTFVVGYSDKESGKERVSLVLRRDGLAGWKLSGVRLGADGER
ncbi:MAG TPA: DUF2939 domain-containing protein [Longimicrobiaceae bacterium]|nr:DUF2939 domain-containing protein [Longimicrobiaceae bacterium]